MSGILKGGDLNPGERHSRDTRDDGTVTLCTLRAATVLSRDCRADFGRPLPKKVMSHSRDGPGVTAPLRTNIVPLTRVWVEYPPLPLTPLKKSPRMALKAKEWFTESGAFATLNFDRDFQSAGSHRVAGKLPQITCDSLGKLEWGCLGGVVSFFPHWIPLGPLGLHN